MPTPAAQSPQYFAAKPAEEAAAIIFDKVEKRRLWLWSSGLARRWMKSYRAYYGLGDAANSAELSFTGEQGELVAAKANHFRALVQQTLVMTTAQKPGVTPVATNTDYDSLAETQLASGLLDYYWREKKLTRLWRTAVEYALVMSEGNIVSEWDPNLGEDVAADEDGRTIKDGDLSFEVLSPFDVTRETGCNSAEGSPWAVVERRVNRHDYAARYPEKAEQLLAIKDDFHSRQVALRIGAEASSDSDQISVYTFFHKRSEALPAGRLMILAARDCVLFDGPLPYKRIPVYRIAPGELLGTAFGYSTLFDLLGLQEGVDMLTSIPLTNQSAFGVQNVVTEDDSNISRKDLGGGLNVIKVKKGSQFPQPLQLTSTPAEVFTFREQLRSDMQTISGNNSVTMGNVDRQMSGAAMALQASMAVQYHSGLQEGAASLVEDIDTGIIEILQAYATTERVAAIAGKSETYTLASFTGESIGNIARVTVEQVNPLMKTQQGRMEIGQMLLSKVDGSGRPLIPDGRQFLTFINTGKLEPLFENEQANLLRIRKDKELLQSGGMPTPLVTDTHWLDIPEYLSVLAMPDARTKPKVVQAVLAVVQQKLDLWRTMDPALLALLGGPPPPALVAPMPPGVSGTPPPQQGPSTATTPPVIPPEATTGTEGPSMPQMPTNPQTGQRFEPQAGPALQ